MNFNPDNIKIETKKRISQDKERQEKYLEILKSCSEEHHNNLDDFIDIYGQEEINQDKRAVEIRSLQFQAEETEQIQSLKRISDIYEGVIVQQAEQNAWFGENVTLHGHFKI
jgi:hypothetical protein